MSLNNPEVPRKVRLGEQTGKLRIEAQLEVLFSEHPVSLSHKAAQEKEEKMVREVPLLHTARTQDQERPWQSAGQQTDY